MPPTTPRRWVALALAAAGCHGGPPAGDADRTAARSPGLGFLRPFDAKAAKVELTRAAVTAPGKEQQVLVAAVYDRDGKPLSRRRVEWTIDGPGVIIEADESGLFPGRRTAGDTSAASTTGASERRVTRGTDDPADDFTVRAGQTWCVVSTPAGAPTIVTASVPGVPDRASVTLGGEGRFRFPPPAAARVGGEATLTTTVAEPTDAAGRPVRYTVRYRIAGGTPAVFAGGQEADVPADADGAASVRLTQPTPRPGTTRVAVEVVKPDPDGVGPGKVVGRSETTVEWSAPQLSLDVALPPAIALNRDAPVTITLANAGRADGAAATVRAALPEGAEFVRADPAPTRRTGRDLAWEFGPVPGGAKREVTLVLRPTRRGELVLPASAEAEGGLRADKRASARVDTAGLKVAADAAPAAAGGTATVRVHVTNTGAVPLDAATVWVTPGDGLRHESGANPVEAAVGPVEPGRTATVEVPFAAGKSGKVPVRVNVAAGGGLADRADVTVVVSRSELTAAVTGPDAVPVGEEALFEVRVTNAGDAAVTNAEVRVVLPAGLSVRPSGDGQVFSPPSLLGKGAGGSGEGLNPAPGPTPKRGGEKGRDVTRPLGPINPGETKVVRLTLSGDYLLDRGTLAVTASADGAGLTAKASAPVAVVGRPVLTMELTEPPGPPTVGGRASYRVTVRNRGTGPARAVEVTADLSGGLTPTRGTGPDRSAATIDGGRVVFPAVAELPAGGAAVFVVEADGSSPGDARVAVRAEAKELSAPLREEQAARVLKRR